MNDTEIIKWNNFIIITVSACVEILKFSDEKPSNQEDLLSTIMKSEFTFDKNGRPVGCGPDSLDMFSVAVKIKFDSKIDMFNYPAMKVCTFSLIFLGGRKINYTFVSAKELNAFDFMKIF